MAEHANWVSRVFSTNDAELKSNLAMRSYDQLYQTKFEKLRNGSQSHAVVVIEYQVK